MLWRVAFPLAPFGAIASLSSERNAVNKSSALTMNRFSSRCAIDAKEEFVANLNLRSLLFAEQVRLARFARLLSAPWRLVFQSASVVMQRSLVEPQFASA